MNIYKWERMMRFSLACGVLILSGALSLWFSCPASAGPPAKPLASDEDNECRHVLPLALLRTCCAHHSDCLTVGSVASVGKGCLHSRRVTAVGSAAGSVGRSVLLHLDCIASTSVRTEAAAALVLGARLRRQ